MLSCVAAEERGNPGQLDPENGLALTHLLSLQRRVEINFIAYLLVSNSMLRVGDNDK